jgi:uroporphyrinogen III methyltransferase/synthase
MSSLPLLHQRIVVTRSTDQADELCAKLAALGATAVRFPVIQFTPLPAPELDTALAHLHQYAWLIFTSVNAVRFFFGDGETRRQGEREWISAIRNTQYAIRIAAVGSATQALLQQYGLPVDFVPTEFTGEQLALGLGDVAGQRILLPRARIGRPEIVALLRERGALVDDIALYDTVTAVPTPEALAELEKGADVITFTSPSSVRNFYKIRETRPDKFEKPVRSALIAAIGPSTAAEAAKFGLTVEIMPDEYTIDGLVTAVVENVIRDA